MQAEHRISSYLPYERCVYKLRYWSMDQNNNMQKCVERKKGAMLPDGRKGLILHHYDKIFSVYGE